MSERAFKVYKCDYCGKEVIVEDGARLRPRCTCDAGHFKQKCVVGMDVSRDGDICEWVGAFDGHYNISCVNETGQRANGNFKKNPNVLYKKDPTWEFKFCPYCGREIVID